MLLAGSPRPRHGSMLCSLLGADSGHGCPVASYSLQTALLFLLIEGPAARHGARTCMRRRPASQARCAGGRESIVRPGSREQARSSRRDRWLPCCFTRCSLLGVLGGSRCGSIDRTEQQRQTSRPAGDGNTLVCPLSGLARRTHRTPPRAPAQHGPGQVHVPCCVAPAQPSGGRG